MKMRRGVHFRTDKRRSGNLAVFSNLNGIKVIANPALFFYVRPQGTDTIRDAPAGNPAMVFNSTGANAKLRCIVPGIWEIVEAHGTIGWAP
ncbi:MAG: hypothetical protein M3Q69_19095 [Acidobacteriota bacterium]|nr:hypothetical protein [Acidobacteriota bacterium]